MLYSNGGYSLACSILLYLFGIRLRSYSEENNSEIQLDVAENKQQAAPSFSDGILQFVQKRPAIL